MSTRPPVFKPTQVFTWESEPVNERPSEFAVSAFISSYGRSSEFASSSFMDAAPARQRKRGSARLLRVGVIAMLCILLAFGAVALFGWLFA